LNAVPEPERGQLIVRFERDAADAKAPATGRFALVLRRVSPAAS
jgi:hypothetical protein